LDDRLERVAQVSNWFLGVDNAVDKFDVGFGTTFGMGFQVRKNMAVYRGKLGEGKKK